jgi:phage terminase small subunit
MAELTDKQQRFCEEYLIDLNATQAAIRAGYSVKTANEQGARLLANVSVSAYIEEKQAVISEKLDLSHEWVLLRFKEISDRCMQAEEVTTKDDQGNIVGTGEWKFDSSGAVKATENIGKHLGFYEAHNKQKNPADITKRPVVVLKDGTVLEL